MGLTTEYKEKTEYLPLPADVYHARLLDIAAKNGTYGDYWIWKFEVDKNEVPDGNYSTWQWAFTNCNVHPNSESKKSPRKFAAALQGRAIEDEEFVDGNEYLDLVGQTCRLALGVERGKDGTERNRVNDVLPIRQTVTSGTNRKQPAVSAEPVEDATEGQIKIDFEPHKAERMERYQAMCEQLKKDAPAWDKFKAFYKAEYKGKFEEQSAEDQKAVLAKMDSLADIEW